MNCACEGSRLCTPYENLMPDDLGGPEGSGCKYRLSLAERSDCTETIINQLLADSHQNPISEWQVKTSSGLPLILHYGELYNYFIVYYNVIIEIKCTINVMHLNRPETAPSPWSVEKLSSMKPVSGAKKVGDRCSLSPLVPFQFSSTSRNPNFIHEQKN